MMISLKFKVFVEFSILGHMKKFLFISLVVSLFTSCSSSLNLEDYYTDHAKDLDEFYLSDVYKVKSYIYVDAGVQNAGSFKADKVILLWRFLYSLEDVRLNEKDLKESYQTFRKGLVKMNFRRDKDVDGHFIGDYLLVFGPNSLVGNNDTKYALLSLQERSIISLSYQKYDFKEEYLDMLVSKFKRTGN